MAGAAMVAAAVPLAVTLAAPPASAGDSGQQIAFNYDGPAYGFAYIQGWNQDGSYVTSPSVSFGYSGYGQLDGWWWEGSVYIRLFDSSGTPVSSYSCDVPVSQWWSDWAYC